MTITREPYYSADQADALFGGAPLAHTHTAADIVSGVIAMARLATGVPDGTKFIRDDGTLAAAGGGGAHAASHENGGADEISVAGLSGLLADAQTPLAHVHAPGDVTGTAVVTADARLSDARTPLAHKVSHENGGSDELNVAGLNGVLADPQPPIIGGGAAQAVAGNDARLTDARTPLAHTHIPADVNPSGTNGQVLTTVAGVSAWATPGAGGITRGTGTVDFLTGLMDASVAVADAAIVAGSKIDAFLLVPADDVARMRDEYWIEDLDVRAGNIDPGVGFTLFAKCNFKTALGQYVVNYAY